MKKIIYILLSVSLFVALFLVSPYVIDSLQFKSVQKAIQSARASGNISVYEGFNSSTVTNCQLSCYVMGVPTCCTGGTLCFTKTVAECLSYADLQVTLSAGGAICPAYLLDVATEVKIVEGSKNVIIGGTGCSQMKFAASEKGCSGSGCIAKINDPKVYAFKNTIKSFIDKYIIAGFKK